MNPDELVLYTFAVSHFSEKIRWALDASGIAYREVTWTPSLHLGRAFLKSRRGTTVPIVEMGGETVQDSTDILHFLAERKAPFDLLPAEPDLRKEVLEIEDRFDRVGDAVIRYAYSVVLAEPDRVLEAWLPRANRLEKALLPAIFPSMIIPILRRKYEIRPDAVQRARDVIASGIQWLDERVSDGRKYLAGDRFTAADVTAASLLAPLACPDEHAVYSTPSYRAGIGPGVEAFAGSRSFDWVRRLYKEERRPRAGVRG
ncbi:MAG TPA: glutathione S-transferase family protein [Polyangiaceae bacterium]|nr:glutathione S-transferase family protein [Polyangiaceae bacterium]